MSNLKIGVMGTLRGRDFMKTLQYIDGADVVAVCETDEKSLEYAKKYITQDVKVYSDYDEFINSGLDGVILCNYFHEHTPYSIKAFKAGVPVLSETTAATSLGECVELVEACEKYNGTYMLAVNCMYFKSVHTMKMKIDSGESGKPLYGEAEYIHSADPVPGGHAQHTEPIDMDNLHWRQTIPNNMYNMHSLAPLMYITDTMPKTVSCKMIRHERPEKVHDCIASLTVTEMDNGSVFNTSGCAGLVPTSKWYRLACENMTMETERYEWRESKLIVAKRASYFEHSFPSEQEAGLIGENDNIDTSDVVAAGHGGIDYYVAYHFVKVLQGEEEPYFDVYRAATLSAVGILGWYSALSNSCQFDVPDFKNQSDRDSIRNDWRNPFGKKYSDLTLPCRLDEKDKFKL